jgi:hypothetical protein
LRTPLGVTIIGGLLLSQFLTLYTTPVIYLAMDGLKRRIERLFGIEEEVSTAPPGGPAAPQTRG